MGGRIRRRLPSATPARSGALGRHDVVRDAPRPRSAGRSVPPQRRLGRRGRRPALDGSGWHDEGLAFGAGVAGLWGLGPDDLWAVGWEPDGTARAMHWDGADWTLADLAASGRDEGGALYDVWGPARDDVWAVGAYGTLAHLAGGEWTIDRIPSRFDLAGLWGTAPDDIWIVGRNISMEALVVHWDGASWSSPGCFPVTGASGIWGASAGEVWIVGDFWGEPVRWRQ